MKTNKTQCLTIPFTLSLLVSHVRADGDVSNSYHDGPPARGEKPLGPFYEMESSSPAAALAPGKSLTHIHRTIHLSGSPAELDLVAKTVLGVSIETIKTALNP